MVGPKLSSIISKYLKTPYWRNKVDSDGKIIEEGPFDGKGTPEQIQYATVCAAEKESLIYQNMSEDDKYKLQVKNHIGIECSGLAYNLLDAHYQDKGQAGIYYKLAGYWRGVKRYGVRTVSATSMALLENSEKRISVLELATGDLIILMGKDGVGHVIFIVGIENNSIECIHNSSESAKPYVHTFTIEITNPDLSIEKQVWHENNIHGQSFLEAFELNDTITGVYRPRFLCQ